MPVLKLVGLAVLWFSRVAPKKLENHNEIVKGIGKWSMLDVFWLGYVLFLLASENIIPGCIGMEGMWWMLAYIICNYALDIIVHNWIPRVVNLSQDKFS